MATTTGADHNGFLPATAEKDFQPTTSNGYAHGHHQHEAEHANGHQLGHQLHPSYSNNVPALAFGGALQPGVWRPYEHRKFANPAPLGLCAFALTTFVLSCVNLHARGVTAPNIVVPLAFAYGGLVQLLAGMWYVGSLVLNRVLFFFPLLFLTPLHPHEPGPGKRETGDVPPTFIGASDRGEPPLGVRLGPRL